MITFSQIPTNRRLPGILVEFDSSNAAAGLAIQPYRVLLIGQKTAAGSQAELVPVRVLTSDQAAEFFGARSMLAAMFAAYFDNNQGTEVWGIALDDPGGSVAATRSIVFGGAPTEARTLNLYVAGRHIQVAVSPSQSSSDVAAAVAAAITADAFSPITAAVNGGDADQVDLTAANQGAFGNSLDVRHSYQVGQALPAGLTLDVDGSGGRVATLAGGSGDPDLSTVVAAISASWFNVIASPYTDAASLTELETELKDRFGPIRAMEGIGITAARGTVGTLAALGDGRNSGFVSIVGMPSMPTPEHRVAAAVAGHGAFVASNDPSRQWTGRLLRGVLGPEEPDRFDDEQLDSLLFDGISVISEDEAGVRIRRMVTTYETNEQGIPDEAFLDTRIPLHLGFLRFDLRQLAAKFDGFKVADDGSSLSAASKVVTPSILRNEVIARARQWEQSGLVEGVDEWKTQIQVTRDAQDPTALNVLIPPNLINPLYRINVQVAFRL